MLSIIQTDHWPGWTADRILTGGVRKSWPRSKHQFKCQISFEGCRHAPKKKKKKWENVHVVWKAASLAKTINPHRNKLFLVFLNELFTGRQTFICYIISLLKNYNLSQTLKKKKPCERFSNWKTKTFFSLKWLKRKRWVGRSGVREKTKTKKSNQQLDDRTDWS